MALVKLIRGDQAGAKITVEAARRKLEPWEDRVGVVQLESEWLDIIEQRINNASFPTSQSAAD
ncbi:MAG: hypothetical protein ACJ789_21400 [Thermomicrobiales bacterium]